VPTLPPSSTCNVVNAAGVCVGITTGSVAQTVGVADPLASSGSVHVVGAVDTYRISLPTGGSATFPCVVLTADETGNTGCTAFGATYVSRVATLVDDYAVGATPLATVKVCAAALTATVAGFGVQDVPGYTLC
jgi:hypothetical protein